MVKWVFLFFVIALVASGWFVSQDDAPGWAPVLPTGVLAAGVLSGIGYAIWHAKQRQKELSAVAVRLGLQFADAKHGEEFRAAGLGALKLFVYCRAAGQLSFLQRAVSPNFHNVMHGRTGDGELYLFDYSTSSGRSAPNQRGTFACFHTPGGGLADLEIVPRLWGERPEWMKALMDAPPARRRLEGLDGTFAAEYQVYSADEASARERLSGDLLRFFSEPLQTGWRVEMSGEWLAVTRLSPAKKIGGLNEPMEPDSLPGEARYSYQENSIAPRHIPSFLESARRIHSLLTGR